MKHNQRCPHIWHCFSFISKFIKMRIPPSKDQKYFLNLLTNFNLTDMMGLILYKVNGDCQVHLCLGSLFLFIEFRIRKEVV